MAVDPQLTGTFPAAVTKLVSLEYAWIGSNRFFGTFPATFAALPRLMELNLNDGGQLSGTIQEAYCDAQSLYAFYVGRLGLTGTLPPCLSKLDMQGFCIYVRVRRVAASLHLHVWLPRC